MSTRTYTEEEIQELTDRVFLIKQQLDAGKLSISPHLIDGFRQSWEAIRLRSDGLVDPDTLDGRIRATALAMQAFKYREEAKEKVSIQAIQDAYFTFLDRQFGWIFEGMTEAKATPSDAGGVFARDLNFVSRVIDAFPDMSTELAEFWKLVLDPGIYHLQDGQQLKASFAGDLFPAHWENVVSTAGLYVDTIVLPCPIMRVARLHRRIADTEFVRLLVKHTMTAMSYRSLATADLSPPLVLILPDGEDFDSEAANHLMSRAQPAICKHAQYLFGRSFESVPDLKEFCDHLHTVEQVLKELKGPDRLVFDVDWGNKAESQLRRAMSEEALTTHGIESEIAGHHVFLSCIGRMPQAIAAKDNALELGGTPFINAETSWLYYSWLLDYEAALFPANEIEAKSMHVTRALAAEKQTNLEWLGNVPPETVLEIRKAGLAGEVREILSRGLTELISANPNNYFRTADAVVENLNQAFSQHQKHLEEAKKEKLKFYGVDVGSCLTVGGIAVAAALTGDASLGAVSGVLGIVGLPNLKDIKTNYKKLAEEDKRRRQSPTGLLFKHLR